MNCEEFRELKDRYLQGKTTPLEERSIEQHLKRCSACRDILDQAVMDSEEEGRIPGLAPDKLPLNMDERKQQRILRRAKYKNRFSMALFLLALFILLNIGGSILSSLYFNWGGEDAKLYRTQKTASLLTEFTFPNVTMPVRIDPFPLALSGAGWGHSFLEIKPYFAARGVYAMEKRIGKQDYTIGGLNINQFLSSMVVDWQWEDGSFNNYLYFFHPDQLNDPESGEMELNPIHITDEIWRALEVLPEGTVAEMSVSFTSTYLLDEVKALFADYDVDVTWYAVSTGLEANPHYPEDRQRPLAAFQGVWGLPESSHNRLGGIDLDDSSQQQEYFLKSMEFLVQNENIARRIFRGEPENLQVSKRYQYIEKNGIHVYGVVVTGPTQELLKLKELEVIHSPGLGEVRLWNWFNRSFEGHMY